MNTIKLILFKLLPLKWISRINGKLMKTRLPKFILNPALAWYIRKYKVNLDEAEKSPNDYNSLNEFFTRLLKPGSRKIDASKNSLVSPVDGRILTFGDITDGFMLQAKGMGSTLEDMVDIAGFRKRFEGGKYIIIYLSPTDYHRIHAPLSGDILGMSYLKGRLYPVNSFAVNNIDRLFSVNERVITYIESSGKLCGVVKVGATNVGSITVVYDKHFRSNTTGKASSQVFMNKIPIKKGDELAKFGLGSTVILLLEKGFAKLTRLEEYATVRMGQKLADLK